MMKLIDPHTGEKLAPEDVFSEDSSEVAQEEVQETVTVRKKKVCILGTAWTKKDAPWGDDSYDFWTLSPTLSHPDIDHGKIDVLFEMHPERYWKSDEVISRLRGFDGPVYMIDRVPEIPNSVRYPIERAREEFYIPAMGDDLYVTNSITWIMMLAYLEGYEEFYLYGVHMEMNSEYGYQKPGCEYLIGYLQAKGKKVVIGEGSPILKTPYLYGYKEPEILPRLNEDQAGLRQGLNELKAQLDTARRKYQQQEGAIEYITQLKRKLGVYG